jgi:hypothetical protein
LLENSNYNGLGVEFDFDITPDAEVSKFWIVAGHGMKGERVWIVII